MESWNKIRDDLMAFGGEKSDGRKKREDEAKKDRIETIKREWKKRRERRRK